MKLLTRFLHIYIDELTYKALKEMAETNGISMGEIVRASLREFFSKFEQEEDK